MIFKFVIAVMLVDIIHSASTSPLLANSLKVREDCYEMSINSNCSCSSALKDVKIACPGQGYDPKIMIGIRHNTHVQIDCHNLDHSEYALLPKMNIGSSPMVQMRQCPLQPIRSGFQRLGITQVNALLFETAGGSLSRIHFEGLNDLRRLRLNGLSALPDELFADLKSLTWLDLRSSKLNLPPGFFSNLHHLRELRLSCGLETIRADVFANSTSMQTITISENKLKELPQHLFANQVELINLDLSHNLLTSLPDDIFQNTRSLTVLRLSYNALENITSDVFSALTKLEYLHLDNNNLRSISVWAFTSTLKLTFLNMENNQITLEESFAGIFDFRDLRVETSSPFQQLRELHTLNLRNNSISHIFRDWRLNNLNLRSLDLSYNNITVITNIDMQYLSRDIFINLTHNNIRQISFYEIGSLDLDTESQKINVALSFNPIYCDCGVLFFVQFLKGRIAPKLRKALKLGVDNLSCAGGPGNLKGRAVTKLLPMELLCPLEHSPGQMRVCPDACSCWVRLFDHVLVVNCSNANLTEVPALPDLRTVRLNGTDLFIENNRLTKLPPVTSVGYQDVIRIFASNNNLTEISADTLPEKLSLLDVSHNKLTALNNTILEKFNESRGGYIIDLSHNPWRCDCSSQDLINFVQTNSRRIYNFKNLHCSTGQTFQEFTVSSICPLTQSLIFRASVFIAVIGLCVGALYIKYQNNIEVWLFANDMCLWYVTKKELDKDKMYDAFISYSHKDEDFILKHLLPELESGPLPFNLCVHYRDWAEGEFILNQIVNSVNESRRTIIVLSASFLEFIWSRMEYRVAHTVALKEGRSRLIIIIYGDIGNMESLEPQLKSDLQMYTCIRWDDPWFWEKLRYAMPHPSREEVKAALKLSMDETLQVKADLV